MKEYLQSRNRLSFLEALGLIIVFLTIGVWGASVTAMGIMAAAQQIGGTLGVYLMETGADRVMRRCLMGWAALFIMALLIRAGWRGWDDCGFSSEDPQGSEWTWWKLVLMGIGVGLVTLGSLSLLALFLGQRIITPVADGGEMLRQAISFIGSGVTVALIEETICRGILFRVLARMWSAGPAALLTSLLFALAHFLSPDPQAFHGASFLQTSLNIFISTYTAAGRTVAHLLVFINLTLLGIVFCGFVVRTRTIWLSIGTHAAWVWVVKSFHLWTAPAPSVPPTLWLGQRSDFMDSLVVTAVLAGMMVWAFHRSLPTGSLLLWQGLSWHVAPEARERVAEWLARHFKDGGLNQGVLLKDDDGCRVMAQAGVVLKSYWPKRGGAGIHFAIRPSRARRAFRQGRKLLALGIVTPAPLAWAVKRRWGFLRAEYALIAEVIGAEPLTAWLGRNIRDPAARARVHSEASERVMAAYGRLMAMFHQNGYSNRDLKHENVMCSARELWALQVIDLDGVRHWRWITRRRAGRDLMRVGKSLASLGWTGETDIQAFFEAYNAAVRPRLHRHAFPL